MVPNTVKQSRVRLSTAEWAEMLRNEPELATAHSPLKRLDLLMRAQGALPESRQRSRKALYSLVVSREKEFEATISTITAKVNQISQHQATTDQHDVCPSQDNEPADNTIVPPTELGKPLKGQKDEKKPRRLRWGNRDFIQIAHDDEVKALLGKDQRTPAAVLASAVSRAQRRQLPADRWRTDSGLLQACYGHSEHTMLTLLRRAMRFPPIRPPAPVPGAPVAQSTPAAPAAAPTAAADPTPSPSTSPDSEGTSKAPCVLAQALAQALDDQHKANRAVLTAALDLHRQEWESAVSESLKLMMNQALAEQDGRIREAVRATIAEVLGEPAPGQAPPTPDFHADMAAQAQAQAAIQNMNRPPRPRVDVVGLLNGQAEIVKKACGASFDLRFIGANEALRTTFTAPVTVLVRKFVGHDAEACVRKQGAKLVYANGGPESVVKALQELT